MEARKYSISNKTRQSYLSPRVKVVDSTFEPLTVLRVLVEGLARNDDGGLWLTHVTGIPVVPRISPFDLVYLDKDNRVIEAVELLPAADPPPFRAPARTALVLPFRTISSSRICAGDSLVLSETQDGKEAVAPVKRIVAAAAPPALAPEAAVAAKEPPVPVELPAPIEVVAQVQQEPPLPLEEDEAPDESAAARELLQSSPKYRPRRHRGRTRRREKQPRDKQGSVDFNLRPNDAPIVRFQHGREDAVPATAPMLAASLVEPAAIPAELEIAPVPAATSPVTEPAVEPNAEAAVASATSVDREPVAAVGEASQVAEPETLRSEPGAVAVSAEPIAAAPEQIAESAFKPAIAAGTETQVHAELAAEPVAAAAEVEISLDAEPMPAHVAELPVAAVPESAITIVEARPVELVEATEAPNTAAESAIPVADLARLQTAEVSLPAEVESPLAPPALPIVDLPRPATPEPRDRNQVVNRILRWLYPAAYEKERRTSPRRPTPGLVAYTPEPESPHMFEVGNISSSGIYLFTDEKWNPGDSLTFLLQRSGPPEQSVDRRYELRAGAVRRGEDGVGFSFILPAGESMNLWEDAPLRDAFEAEPDSVVRELRLARALAFFRRICPPGVETIKGLLRHDFSNLRVANAVTIALLAEELLEQEPDADKKLIHPDLLVRILEDGSWVDVDRVRKLWAGLILTSCSADGQDESNKPFVELMSQLTPTHTRILGAVCARVKQAEPQAADAPRPPIFCTPDEMVKMSGSTNLIKIQKTVAELANLGLLEMTVRSSFISYTESARTTPTQLGMEMFARCQGHREHV